MNPSSASGTSKKFNISWEPNPDHLAYALYSEGFRPGFARSNLPTVCVDDARELGIDPAASQVNPDRVKSYEIGAKNRLFNRSLTLNVSAYHIKWSGIQLGVFLPCGFTFASNAGDAEINGLEIETETRISNALLVGGNLAYTDAKLSRVLPGTVAQPGDKVLGTPEWQASAHVTYRFSGPFGSEASWRVDGQYTGKTLLFYDTNPATAPAPLSYRDRPDILLLNSRLAFEKGPWTFAIYGRNLTNRVEIVGFPDALGVNLADRPRFIVNRPRTIGLEIGRRF